jgi:predicted RNA binding protein YcfA (HicA-like mRNA interferase family)
VPKLPVVSSKRLIRLLKKLGYVYKRQCGSHMRFELEGPVSGDGNVTVPDHDEIDKGLLKAILSDISTHTGIHEQELIEMLK